MAGKHRRSEVALRQSHRLMTSSSQAPSTGMRLVRRVTVDCLWGAVSQYEDQTYAAALDGIYRVTSHCQSSLVIPVNGMVWNISVNEGVIYTLVNTNINGWSVRVYGPNYELIRSWRPNEDSEDSEDCEDIYQFVVRKETVLVAHRGSKTIIQNSLTGEVKKRIPCPILSNMAIHNTWLCVMPSRHDAVIMSCNGTVYCIDVSTGHCLWSTSSLEKPTAVCCDDADRVYVAVCGEADTIQIAILDGDTGKSVFPSQTHPCFSYCSTFVSFN